MLLKSLYLQPGDGRKIWPFFVFYFGLFTMLSLGDGISLSLFVNRLGVTQLPWAYGLNALVSISISLLYIRFFRHRSNQTCFYVILGGAVLGFFLNWLSITLGIAPNLCYRMLFISQDLSNTFIFMHFAVWLQDFFTKKEMNRILPVIFIGGRLGGIGGGMLLAFLSHAIGVVNLVLFYVGMGTLLLFVLRPLYHHGTAQMIHLTDAEALDNDYESQPEGQANMIAGWLFATAFIFITCRWFINYQYNTQFHAIFNNAEEMASFLGLYNIVALWVSLIIQVLFLGRLLDWLGLKWLQALYSIFMIGILGLNVCVHSLPMAVFSRFVENELRLVVRNPTMVLMSNYFDRVKRKEVRAISFGVILPLGTLFASTSLVILQHRFNLQMISWFGFAMGLLYLFCSIVLLKVFQEPVSPWERWLNRNKTPQTVEVVETPISKS